MFTLCAVLLIACSGDQRLEVTGINDYKGYIIVSAIATDWTGAPGFVSLFAPDGSLVTTLFDFIAPDYGSGVGFIPPNEVVVMVDGSAEIEKYNLNTGKRTVLVSDSTILNGSPTRGLTVSTVDKSIYVSEYSTNTIEKFTPDAAGNYSRSGAPFIPGSSAPCVLDRTWGIAYLPTTDQIAVLNQNNPGGISIFNSDGTCVRFINTGALSVNPIAIAYHALTNKLIVALTNSNIYSVNLDGSGVALIFSDSGIINAPRSVETDDEGFIYISNSGRDTVEKFIYSGTGLAVRATAGPLIGPRGFSANAQQIKVIP